MVKDMLTHDTRRLTPEEIEREYPNQWLGLTDVKWTEHKGLVSAIVSYSNMTKSESSRLMLNTKQSQTPVQQWQTLIPDDTYVVLAQ